MGEVPLYGSAPVGERPATMLVTWGAATPLTSNLLFFFITLKPSVE